MQRNSKVAIIGIVAMLILALPLSAQTPPAPLETLGDLESNTYKATAGLFGNDVDNYMDVRGYSDVEFDKWFAFLSGDSTPKVSVGYGRKFQDLYLGMWYQGNIVNLGKGSETSTIEPTYDDDTKALTQTVKTKSYSTDDSWIQSANQVEFLLGIAGQGIKVGFYEAVTQNKLAGSNARDFVVTDYQNGLVTYADEVDEYSRVLGYLRPYLGWGSNFNLAGGTLSPYAKFTLDCYQDTQIDNTKSYEVFLGKKSETVQSDKYAGHQAGYVEPAFSLGADYILPKSGKPEMSFGLGYDLSFRVYDNDYAASGISGKAKGPVNWENGSVNTTSFIDRKETDISAELSFADAAYSSHVITPSFLMTGEFYGNLKMGLYLELPIGINALSLNQYRDNYAISKIEYRTGDKGNNSVDTTRVHYNDDLTEVTNFSIGANLCMGFSYPLIRDRFSINGGVSISPFVWNRATTKVSPNGVTQVTYTTLRNGNGETLTDTTVIDDPAQSGNDSVTVEDTWEYLYGQVSGGFVFYFGAHSALDLLVSQSFNGDLFGLEATSFNLMFTITF